MRGLWLENERVRYRDDVPDPQPAPGEAIVRVRLAGVCNTDLEMVKGYYAFTGVPGHEFVGEVERADGAPEWVGRRVAGEINATCGACAACAAGRRSHCEQRTVLGLIGRNGTFAERLALPVANLHAVPDAVPDAGAVFTEPLAAAFEILEQVPVARGTRCLVLGDGKLGLLVAQVLAGAGARVHAVGRHPEKLALLARRGIETSLAGDGAPEPCELVVEATGSADGFRTAVAATLPRGTLVLKSTLADSPRVDLAPLVIHEIRVVGSRCGPFAPALHALANAAVDVLPLISARVPLARAEAALTLAAAPGALKVLIES